MSNITYKQYPNSLAVWGIGVFLDNKLTGYIERTIIGYLNSDSENPTPVYGYYYNPNGGGPQNIGKQFATIEEVKASL